MSALDDIYGFLPYSNGNMPGSLGNLPNNSNAVQNSMIPNLLGSNSGAFPATPMTPAPSNGGDNLMKTLGLGHQDTAQQIAKIAGTAAGNAIAPGVGGMIGGVVLPAVVGLGESLFGGAKKKKAQGLLPGSEDPMERRRLSELDNMRRTFETGSAYGSQLKQLKNIQANTIKGLTRASAGNTGQLLASINMAGLNAADAYGKVAGQGTERQDAYNGMYGNLIESMAQRRAALQMQQYTQKATEGAEQQKSGNQTLMSLLGIAGNFMGTGSTGAASSLSSLL